YAGHGFRNAVHADLVADHVRIGVEALAPIDVGQNGDVVGFIGSFGFRESAPETRPDTERSEKLGRDPRDLRAFRGAGLANNPRTKVVERERCESWNAAAPFVVIGDGGAIAVDARFRVS